jgi:hypothetical protein
MNFLLSYELAILGEAAASIYSFPKRSNFVWANIEATMVVK